MDDMRQRLAILETLEGYGKAFVDRALWEPCVREVCARMGAADCCVRSVLPGTCPTFIVDDRWVIKFFGRLFEGGKSFAVEREIHRSWLSGEGAQGLPVAALIADGALFTVSAGQSGALSTGEGWPWPYLVYEYIPGVSIGEAYADVGAAGRLALAEDMGHIVRRLHTLVPAQRDTAEAVLRPDWAPYLAFLAEQRARCVETQRS